MPTDLYRERGDRVGSATYTPTIEKCRLGFSLLGKFKTVEYFVLLFGDTRLAA